jgi:hypothetical protein
MPETFAQFLDKWLKQSTVQGLNNPLVKMPVKRFRSLPPVEFNSIANGGSLAVGTMSDPVLQRLVLRRRTGSMSARTCHRHWSSLTLRA